jgi:hypothetical protein
MRLGLGPADLGEFILARAVQDSRGISASALRLPGPGIQVTVGPGDFKLASRSLRLEKLRSPPGNRVCTVCHGMP